MSGLRDAYRRYRRRVPPGVRERVPRPVRDAVGTRLGDPGELREWDPRARATGPDPLLAHEFTNAAYVRLDADDIAA
ncbi:MAG: hypothetical protein QOJ12_1483, partial [Thermoleophilales bacterium]|nr:hypothetical protein [Thermoleophilales bacterium]